MNDDPSIPDEPQASPAEEKRGETREALHDLGDAVKKAFRAGAHDARRAAKSAVPKAGEQFAKGLHDIAYGIAYLASFGCALVRQITPDPIADGLSEGADAGREAVEKLAEKRRQAREASADAVEDDDPQPATA
jgi:hypothetical protein